MDIIQELEVCHFANFKTEASIVQKLDLLFSLAKPNTDTRSCNKYELHLETILRIIAVL